jgi:mono/diheme cytochrome c family protein
MNCAALLFFLFLTALAAHSLAGETNLVGAASVKAGRSLFLKNCAHCHGDDAHGDEGPDLHGLKKSDEWIARRIRNGVKGEMTAFGEKFSQSDLEALIAYLHTLTAQNCGTNRLLQ